MAADVLLAQRPGCNDGGGNNKMDSGVHFVCTGDRDGDDGGEQSPGHGDDNRLE